MKITIDIDCTPEEARAFLGLPDVRPMQDAVMAALEERLRGGLDRLDPEAMLRLWMPSGMPGPDSLQRAFWSNLAGTGGKPAGGE